MSTTYGNPLQLAGLYLRYGFSIVPILPDGSKKPAEEWKLYQTRRANTKEVGEWFSVERGIAVIGGAVSGNLECVDIDDPGLIDEYFELIKEHAPELFAQLVIVETPGEGRHLIYRCDQIDSNQKLALREYELGDITEEKARELKAYRRKSDNAWCKVYTLIETRGEGGYFIVPGSPARCHPLEREYKLVQGTFRDVPQITIEERAILLDCARSLNEYVKESQQKHEPQLNNGFRPGADFNQRADVATILERHGWRRKGRNRIGERWMRPGGDRPSAVLFSNSKKLYVFSTNATPLEFNTCYSPFALLSTLEHSGDFHEAARALSKEGYGDRTRPGAKQKPAEEVEVKDETLTRYAAAMRRAGMTREAIQIALIIENKRAKPPIDETRVKRIAEEVAKCQPADVPLHFTLSSDGEVRTWETPIPMEKAKKPAFPLHTLSPILRDYVEAVAYSTQTPVDLAGTLGLTAVAGAIHGKFILEVKPGWREWATLYTLSAAPSGSRKSAVFNAIMAPVVGFEIDERRRMKPLVERNKNRKKQIDALITEASKAVNRAKSEEAKGLAQAKLDQLIKEQSQINVLDLPKIFVEDITTERLATLMGRHGERLAIFSPEGDIFKLIAGMYSGNGRANFTLYLKSFDGEWCRIDRQDQDRTVVLDHPSLSIGLFVQPSVIRKLSEEPEFLERGLCQRFLFSSPIDLLGEREVDTADIPEHIRQSYELLLRRLLSIEVPLNSRKEPDPYTIRLTLQAQALVTAFQRETEDLLKDRSVTDGLREWRSKMPGKMVRLALVLSQADSAMDDSGEFVKVDQRHIERAIELIRYFAVHSEEAFGQMKSDPAFHTAEQILEWIKSNPKLEFSRRDLFRGLHRHFRNPDEMNPGLKLLFQLGYIRRKDQPGARRDSSYYLVNPEWMEQALEASPSVTGGGDT